MYYSRTMEGSLQTKYVNALYIHIVNANKTREIIYDFRRKQTCNFAISLNDTHRQR